VFGARVAGEVAALIEQARIRLYGESVTAPVAARTLRFADGHQIHIDRIVTLALACGPRIPGVPCDGGGFVPCDEHGRVPGVPDAYAAGTSHRLRSSRAGSPASRRTRPPSPPPPPPAHDCNHVL
jgi:hypothetical protein